MRFLTQAWSDLGLDPELLAGVPPLGAVPLVARTAVGELAGDAVAAAALAGRLLFAARGGSPPGPLRLDPDRIAAAFAADRYFRLDGERAAAFAPLSGFWPAADGWVRTHANYPHHAARLRALLDLAPDAGPDLVRAASAAAPARQLEDAAAARGAILAAVRSADEWAAEPAGRHVAAQPLLAVTPTGSRRPLPAGPRPLSGVRVLDLTRVLAGPVAARTLAQAGADVLRVDPPALPEIAWQHLDTGQGKRSALLDLGRPVDRAVFDDLLAAADVLVTGYRPGALDRLGLGDDELAARHPGLIVARVSAWGSAGPWGERRGFDSIVQAAIGIADLERRADGTPGALPAQALDHAAGYLLAAGVLAVLAGVQRGEAAHRVEVALARVGAALLATAGPPPEVVPDLPQVEIEQGRGALGVVRCAPPAVPFPATPDRWGEVGRAWGQDPPAWPDAPA